MIRLFTALITLLTAALLGGCASAPYMPLADDNPKADVTKPLYLMTVTLKNDYKQRWQPRVLNVILAGEGGGPKPETFVFRMDGKGTVDSTKEDGSQTFLVRFTTDGRPVTILGMNAIASAFPIHGFYFVPVHTSIPATASGVHYLGAMKAVIRERKNGEFRAGPVIPLIDQAFAGASGGTFDVEILDSYESDVALFKKAFPSLNDLNVARSVLPPWSREKAQAAWEKN